MTLSMEASNHYFYILWCQDNTLYAGYTTDLTRRQAEHNSGTGAKYTYPKSRRPVHMIYAEKFLTRSLAMKREAAFKRLTRAEKDKFLRQVQITLKRPYHESCVEMDWTSKENFDPSNFEGDMIDDR